MIKIIKLRLGNLDNKHLKNAGGHIGRNVVDITKKMMTRVRKPLMIKMTFLGRTRNYFYSEKRTNTRNTFRFMHIYRRVQHEVNFKEFNLFEFIVVLLLDWLPYRGIKSNLPYYLSAAGEKTVVCLTWPRILALCEMQTASLML